VFKAEEHKRHCYGEILHTGIVDDTKCVRLGFQLVKGVGGSIALHKRAPYTDVFDFVTKNREVDAGSFEALIKGGAFDGFGLTRHELMLNLESLLSMRRSVKESNVEDVFAALSADERSSFISLIPCDTPVTDLQRMEWESEYLGFCFTTNFYTAYSHLIEKHTKGETIGSVLQSDQTDGDVAFLGLVYSAKPYRKEFFNKETQEKEKKLMLFLKVGDFDEQIEVGVFEDGLRRSAEQMQVPLSADLIRKNDLILVIGSKKANGRFNTTRIEVLERR
jgi:DNA polymerase III alpha subunit